MPYLLHLNGPPGIGKSTIARRYAEARPGTLVCDIDVLRTMIGGWERDFQGAGALIRPAALAMVEAYLAGGHDVVLPQLLVDPREFERLESVVARSGAAVHERILMDSLPSSLARFDRRGEEGDDDPWHAQVRAIVAAEGGDAVLTRYHGALEELARRRPDAVVIESIEGDVEGTLDRLVRSLG